MENWWKLTRALSRRFLKYTLLVSNGNREETHGSVAAIALSEDHENNLSIKSDHEGLHFLTLRLVSTSFEPCPQTLIYATPQDPLAAYLELFANSLSAMRTTNLWQIKRADFEIDPKNSSQPKKNKR